MTMRCIKPLLVRANYTGTEHYVNVPCGKCIACRINRSEELAGRIQREYERQISLGHYGWFVTFTYDDDHLPPDNSLDRKVVTRLCHRLRNRMFVDKYFFCGEYGSEYGRCHYHAIIFTDESNLWNVYDKCVKSWCNGFVYVKRMHVNSAKYISKYVVKADDRYYKGRQPCFVQMSQKFGMADFVQQSYEVRKLDEIGAPYVYRDVLGKRHPYPRRAISAAFTPAEKEAATFESSYQSDDLKREAWSRSGSADPYEVWLIKYDNLRHDSLEVEYWKNKYYKRK